MTSTRYRTGARLVSPGCGMVYNQSVNHKRKP